MKAVDQLYTTGEEMRDELKKGMDEAKEDIQRTMEGLRDEVSRLTEAASIMAKVTAGPMGLHQGGDPASATYAEVLSRKLPALHLNMLVQTQIKERQVLIDKDPAAMTNHLAELTEHELVMKANEALAHMATQLPHSPPNPSAIGAKHL